MSRSRLRPRPVGVAVLALALVVGCDRSGVQGQAHAPGEVVRGPRDATIRVLPPDAFDAAVRADPSMVVIDVQVPYDGHVDGTDAVVPFDDIAAASVLPEDPTRPVAVYCRTGRMSAVAARTLVSLGYTEVLDLQGGLDAWEASGRELRTDAPRLPPTTR